LEITSSSWLSLPCKSDVWSILIRKINQLKRAYHEILPTERWWPEVYWLKVEYLNECIVMDHLKTYDLARVSRMRWNFLLNLFYCKLFSKGWYSYFR
jgi:hypothetical protein